MNFFKLLFVCCVVYGLIIQGKKWKESRQNNQVLVDAMAEGDLAMQKVGIPQSCLGKQYCITVFVAPWCGACQSSEPGFLTMNRYIASNRPDIGFGIVVGAGTPSENQRKKDELSDLSSRVDEGDAAMKLRNIRAFPTWIATDLRGNEIFRKAAVYHMSSDQEVHALLGEMVGK